MEKSLKLIIAIVLTMEFSSATALELSSNRFAYLAEVKDSFESMPVILNDKTVTPDSIGGKVVSKNELYYDNQGNCLTEYWKAWEPSMQQWVDSIKIENSYNRALKTSFSVYCWSPHRNKWISSYKTELVYNEKWQVVLETVYCGGSILNYWTLCNKYEYGYDKAGNKTKTACFDWNTHSNSWVVNIH
jgi:hypothetical protein